MATASIRQMLPSDPFHTSSSSKQQYHDHDSREASAGPQSPSSPQQQQQQPSSPRSSKQHKSSSNNHHAHHHGHHHGLHLHRSHHSQQQSQQHDGGANGPPEDEETMQRREQEKRSISQWEDLKRPLSPSQIAADPSRKKVGHSMSYLRVEDFALVKTLGTGTFARVWLAKFASAKNEDADKVFALKILRKADVIRLKQVEHVRHERNVLSAVAGHPFITTMIASFQDRDSIYMLLDYCPGGEVFSYLRRARRFNEPTSKFYAAEICLILEFLHEQQGVAYRDLKPENILIDADGHLKLVDFGFAKKVENQETYTLCGTPEYLAPEVIRNTGHGTAVDWWAFGILIYEFLVGQPPFWDQNPMKIYEQIVAGRIRFPAAMPPDARALITQLCNVDVSKRLGNIRGGAGAVKGHAWFADVDWDALYHRRMQGPIVPHLRGKDDARNFDDYEDEPGGREEYTEELFGKWDEAFASF